jgi:hypothetical protein
MRRAKPTVANDSSQGSVNVRVCHIERSETSQNVTVFVYFHKILRFA